MNLDQTGGVPRPPNGFRVEHCCALGRLAGAGAARSPRCWRRAAGEVPTRRRRPLGRVLSGDVHKRRSSSVVHIPVATPGTTSVATPSGGTPSASTTTSTGPSGANPQDVGMVPEGVKPGGTLTVAIGTDISSFETQQTTENRRPASSSISMIRLSGSTTRSGRSSPWLASGVDKISERRQNLHLHTRPTSPSSFTTAPR